MSTLLDKIKICDKIGAKTKRRIRLLHVFDDFNGPNVIYITGRDDCAYGLGSNGFASLGLGHRKPVDTPTIIPGLCEHGVQNIVTGWAFALGLTDEHRVLSWGNNYCGELGRTPAPDNVYLTPAEIPALSDTRVVQLTCGYYHSLALTDDGLVYGWGLNKSGQIGTGVANDETVPVPVRVPFPDTCTIRYVHCSVYSSFALTTDGQVYSWGRNEWCNLGHDHRREQVCGPEVVVNLVGIERVCATDVNTYFVATDRTLYFCGKYATDGGKGPPTGQQTPQELTTAVTDIRVLQTFEWNRQIPAILRQHDNNDHMKTYNVCKFVSANSLEDTRYDNIDEFYATDCQLTSQTVLMSGDSCDDSDSESDTDESVDTDESPTDVTPIDDTVDDTIDDTISDTTCANSVTTDDDNSAAILNKFAIVCDNIGEYTKLDIRLFHVFDDKMGQNLLYVTTDDKVYGLGVNTYGSLGLGHNKAVEESPWLIPELCDKNIQQFINGYDFVVAIGGRQQVYSWGNNARGQLGRLPAANAYTHDDNDHNDSPLLPGVVEFCGDKSVVSVCCGYYHALALKESGDVYGWGDNRKRQIGCGEFMNRAVFRPTRVKFPTITPDTRVRHIYASDYCSFALTTDGRVWSWGSNACYKLGHDIQTPSVYNPRPIAGLTHVYAVCPYGKLTHFLSAEGLIYFCGEYESEDSVFVVQKCPKVLEIGHQFDDLRQLISNKSLVAIKAAISGNKVYQLLDSNDVRETECKSFVDFYATNYQLTLQSICFGDIFDDLDDDDNDGSNNDGKNLFTLTNGSDDNNKCEANNGSDSGIHECELNNGSNNNHIECEVKPDSDEETEEDSDSAEETEKSDENDVDSEDNESTDEENKPKDVSIDNSIETKQNDSLYNDNNERELNGGSDEESEEENDSNEETDKSDESNVNDAKDNGLTVSIQCHVYKDTKCSLKKNVSFNNNIMIKMISLDSEYDYNDDNGSDEGSAEECDNVEETERLEENDGKSEDNESIDGNEDNECELINGLNDDNKQNGESDEDNKDDNLKMGSDDGNKDGELKNSSDNKLKSGSDDELRSASDPKCDKDSDSSDETNNSEESESGTEDSGSVDGDDDDNKSLDSDE